MVICNERPNIDVHRCAKLREKSLAIHRARLFLENYLPSAIAFSGKQMCRDARRGVRAAEIWSVSLPVVRQQLGLATDVRHLTHGTKNQLAQYIQQQRLKIRLPHYQTRDGFVKAARIV